MTAAAAGPSAMDPADRGPGEPQTVGDDVRLADTADVGTAQLGAGQAASAAERIAALTSRLLTPMPDDRLAGWIWPLIITAFAAFLRFNRLSVPNAIIFDETYYVKDAWSILQHGVEWITLPNPVNNSQWLRYHKEMLQFGVGLNARQSYESQPWDWLVITRPVAFYWQSFTNAAGTQEAKSGTTGPWVREVLAIGNPAIWPASTSWPSSRCSGTSTRSCRPGSSRTPTGFPICGIAAAPASAGYRSP